MVGEAFCESTDPSFSRSIHAEKAHLYPELSDYSSRNKTLPLPRYGRSSVIDLQHQTSVISWLITPGSNTVLRAQCWSLLADGPPSCCSQAGLGESMLLSLCITSKPAIGAPSFMSFLGNDRGHWGKRFTGIQRKGHSIHLSINIFSAGVTFDEHSAQATHFFMFLVHSERSIHIPLQNSLTLISKSSSF